MSSVPYTADNYTFLKKWRKQQRDTLQQMYPDATNEELNEFLDEMIAEHVTVPEVQLDNNYEQKAFNTNLLQFVNWMEKTKPIHAGFGVFFRNQHQVINPAATMLQNFMDLRNQYKSQLEHHHEDSYEYGTFDRQQKTEKTATNAYYGASGAESFIFYNLYTATSVTATGQSLISTTEQAFEAFLSNNVKFLDLDDAMHYMENIRKESEKHGPSFLPPVVEKKVIERIMRKFYYPERKFLRPIQLYLSNQSAETLSRIYFKNNIYEFHMLPRVRYLLGVIARKVTGFKNPNKVPPVIAEELDMLWSYVKEFVFYNYPSFDRIARLRRDTRKTVVVVDTDSNFLNIDPWVRFMRKNVYHVDNELAQRDDDDLRFTSINTMCFLITKMIGEVLWKYTKTANVPKEYRKKINMKNEYLLSRLVLTPSKKRYAATVRLREGKEIFPEKLDVKGLDFNKSTTRAETKEYFMDILEKRILKADKISISTVLRDLEDFERIIWDSLHRGEKNFLIPASAKEIESYKDPMKLPQVRSVLAWNYLYPDSTIELPAKIDIIKVNLDSTYHLEKLKVSAPEFYERIDRHILRNRDKQIAEKKVSVIALPRHVEKIPEWIMPYIDFKKIVSDNLSRFYSILDSLGVQTIKSTHREYISNILKI